MDRTKFIIVGLPRSGTNWVVFSLQEHPQVECFGEILDDPHLTTNRQFAEDPIRGVQDLWSATAKRAVGFKLFYFHCWESYPEHRHVWNFLQSQADLKVIILYRENLLKLIVSWELARKTQRWWIRHSVPCDDKVTIDPRSLCSRIASLEAGLVRIRRTFTAHEQMDISYERLFTDRHRHLSDMQSFLGVERMAVPDKCVKQENREIEDIVENFADVRRILVGGPYERFLWT
jgi:LPS sulfotransferase NodH